MQTIITGVDVKKALIDLNMTQYQLAQALDLSTKTVHTICNSKRIKKVYALAIQQLLSTKQG